MTIITEIIDKNKKTGKLEITSENRKFNFFYNEKEDLLEISMGNNIKSKIIEVEPGVFIKIDNKEQIKSIGTHNFKKRTNLKDVKILLPNKIEIVEN